MKRLILAIALLSPVGLVSCAHPTTTTQTPIQSLDLRLAKAFDDAQAALNQARASAVTHPAMKDPLNKIITTYNTAQDAYLAFHNAIKAGGTPDPGTLEAQIVQISADIATLVGQFK